MVSGLAAIAALMGLVAITLESTPSRSAAPIASSSTPSAPSAPIVTAPVPKVSVAGQPAPVAPAASAKASDLAYVEPEDETAWKKLKPGDLMEGDVFEPDLGEPAKARKLRTIGTIAVGVMNGATVPDEHALAAALVKVGAELDAFDRDSSVSPLKRLTDHQAILEKHRATLRPLVTGRVVFRGLGYVLTIDPGSDAGK